ncbi:BamA/TamA family outer membrane protein [Rubrivirga sp. IMCC45206]|uniref:BamA/TamA family outer membrane protein n=1 Tax=Rubrivirga sp. IMCC45206 TaxID=3391614 RepID=UPI003990159D
MTRTTRALRGLTVVAALVGLAASAGAQGFGRNKIQYQGFDWHVLRTEHFDVYYYPEAEDLAAIGAETAEDWYEVLETRFDLSLNHRVPLVFYATNLHFKQTNITPGFIPDGVGGFFEFLKGRVVIPADGDLGRFQRVIRHELVHVFTFNKLARVLRDHRRPTDQFLPLWFTEGLAEFWSGEPDMQHEMILRDAVASNFFVPLHDMGRIAGSFVMYKEGEAFCRFVAEEYGEERLLDLIEESWRSSDFGDVLAVVLGEEDVSDDWEAWIRAQYTPKLVGADVASLTTAPVAARGFNAKPAVWTRPDGGREVVFYSNRGSYSAILAQAVGPNLEPIGDPRRVVEAGRSLDFEAFHLFESRLDVSPDGVLAFVSKRGATDVIHLLDLATGDRLAMLGFDELVAIYSPTVAEGGDRVVFAGIDRGGQADLYVYDRASGVLRQLTNDAYTDREPDLSPDGRMVVFASDRTAYGPEGAFNLFTLDIDTGALNYVTAGPQVDISPRWSPTGDRVAFASARREADGKFSAQDLWLATLDAPRVLAGEGADASPATAEIPGGAELLPDDDTAVELRQLTRFASAGFDPFWADEGSLVFAAFEDFRFTVRSLDLDSLAAAPEQVLAAGVPPVAEPWTYARYEVDGVEGEPYTRRYQLDIAQGGFATTTTASASAGGATVAFSDLLGDDRIYVTAYSANSLQGGRSFLDGLNVSVTRLHLGRRANVGYGAYRLAGPRFDRSDPSQASRIPAYEQRVGVLGLVSYPLSLFRRVDLETSFGYGEKSGLLRTSDRTQTVFDTLRTATLSNALSLVEDHALYGPWGPVQGFRGRLAVGYATDLWQSNESYYSVTVDLRHYLRITNDVQLASWGLFQGNVGRRARLNLIGGSWSLRGFPFLRVRGSKVWFTSHELRFPVMRRPPLFPILAGIRGALFVDAAHNWTDGYNDVFRDPDFSSFDQGEPLLVGTTKGSFGVGLRTSILGAIVLRYDVGYRFADGLDWDEKTRFGQFFFGYDF